MKVTKPRGEKLLREFWDRVVEATPDDMTPGEGYKIVSDKDIEWLLSHQKALSRAEVLEEVRGKIEAMRFDGNITIPVCRKCDYFGTNENYCPICGDNLVNEQHPSSIDTVKNNILSDTLAVVEEIKNKEDYENN